MIYYACENDWYNFLEHHGTKGQKRGVRRYQNPDGSLTPEGRKRYGSMLRDMSIIERRGKIAGQKYGAYLSKAYKATDKGKLKKADKYIAKAEAIDQVHKSDAATYNRMQKELHGLNETARQQSMRSGDRMIRRDNAAVWGGALAGAIIGAHGGIMVSAMTSSMASSSVRNAIDQNINKPYKTAMNYWDE